jgi:hypothetical protein
LLEVTLTIVCVASVCAKIPSNTVCPRRHDSLSTRTEKAPKMIEALPSGVPTVVKNVANNSEQGSAGTPTSSDASALPTTLKALTTTGTFIPLARG